MSGPPLSEQETSESSIMLECDLCHLKLGVVPVSKYVARPAFVPIVRCTMCHKEAK